MFMRKIFWPLITLVFFLSVMTVWFAVGGQERKLNSELSEYIMQNNWLSYDVKGKDVVLYGLAPDAKTRDHLINDIKNIPAVGNVYSEITLPKKIDNNSLTFLVDDDGITLRGAIPADIDRFALINRVEQKKSGTMVYDEMDVGSNGSNELNLFADYVINLLPEMKAGVIEFKNGHVTADAATYNMLLKNHKLPDGLVTDKNCVWQKVEGNFWQNPCDTSNM